MDSAAKKKEDTEKASKKRGRDWFDDDFDGSLKRFGEEKRLTSMSVGSPAETVKITATTMWKDSRCHVPFSGDIYKPKNHVNSEHMEFMLSCVWRRLSAQLIGQRVVILDSWFTQLLKTAHEKYNKGRRVDESFIWNNSLCKYVAGEVSRRPGNVAWLVDVDHWVALCICLRDGKITIYDSNINLHYEAKLGRLVKHLTEIMPLLVNEVAPVHASLYKPARKYEHYRALDVSQNARGRDCGPLTVKFIDLRSQGLPVDGITNEEVDNLRMMYAMEVYREFVEPFP